MSFRRREFLQCLAGLGSSLILATGRLGASPASLTRRIPSSGEHLPVIGLGTWLTFGIDPDDAASMAVRQQLLHEFLQLGGRLVDSSPMYGTAQEVIGRSLQNIGSYKKLFAATKVWVRGYRHAIQQMERSRLLWKIPRFDLMQVHNLLDWQSHLPLLQDMKRTGRLRYIGVTISHGRRHKELIQIMRGQKIDFVQFTYNLLDREAEQELLPLAADLGIAAIINRPFQGGRLFQLLGRQRLPAWAAEIECNHWAQFFLKYIISHPAVTCAIPATSQLTHLQQNMAAVYGNLPDARMRRKMLAYVQA